MTFIDLDIIKLAGGLLLLIAANIGLGSIGAFIAGTWDEVKFRNGCIKGSVVAAALLAVYAAGYLNPNLLVIEVEGETVNLMNAVHVLLMAAFGAYAVDVLAKIKELITTATPGEDDRFLAEAEKVGGSE